MSPPYVTMSWIGLTSLTPLSALLIAWTLVSIHKKRTKSILLLAIVYAQLAFQFLNFTFSTLTLLKLEGPYVGYLSTAFNALLFFKSLSLLSLHLEEFYKIKSPSNYLLNINSSLLKYHLLVVLLLSLMGAYFLRAVDFIPSFGLSDRYLVSFYITFHAIVLLLSLFFLGLKFLIRRRTLDLNVIVGTNSTSSSANLFGLRDGCGSSGGRQGMAASGVAAFNLLINSTLLVCTFWMFWLPGTWPLANVILWSQVLESLLTPGVYWCAHAQRRSNDSNKSSSRYETHLQSSRTESHNPFQSIVNGALCFNNGEFHYFAGGKNNSNETVLNNAMSSEYNTFDSFHQARSYTDSLRCASVTTIANDDFEFLSRGQTGGGAVALPLHLQLESQQQAQFHIGQYETITINKDPPLSECPVRRSKLTGTSRSGRGKGDTATASLSMNDLDLIEIDDYEKGESNATSSSIEVNTTDHGKYKYKKKNHQIRKRYMNRNLTRRVLSLESLHSHVNESQLAYLDTGERVIVFTTDFI